MEYTIFCKVYNNNIVFIYLIDPTDCNIFLIMVCPQVHKMEAELRHKLFPPNAWMNSHPLLSNEAVARVFKRLADRLQGVVSDTSTITITPEYAAHFLEVYVKKTDGAKFTGDRIRLLMLSLPLAVRDLIARHSTHMQSIYHNKPYI